MNKLVYPSEENSYEHLVLQKTIIFSPNLLDHDDNWQHHLSEWHHLQQHSQAVGSLTTRRLAPHSGAQQQC